MHTMPVDFDVSWLTGPGLPRERGRLLLLLLRQLAGSESLREAAASTKISYRFAWGVLSDAEAVLGGPLVDMRRGRPARLSQLGQKVVVADERVRQLLADHLQSLGTEITAALVDAIPSARPRLRLFGSPDLALAQLPENCTDLLELLVEFKEGEEALAALSRGECDVAGFHVADALPRAAVAAAALGKWLDPRRHALICFVRREQGLIVRPGSRIKGVSDLTRRRVKFVHRHDIESAAASRSGGTSVATAVAEGRADAAFGVRAEAAQLKLQFIPLAVERYFFAFAKAARRSTALQALIRILQGADFQARVMRLPGYDISQLGRHEPIDSALSWLVHTSGARERAHTEDLRATQIKTE